MDITRNSILRITDKKTIQLVQEIKKEECLWNTSLDDYPHRLKRAKAAERISRMLNVPNFEPKHVLIKLKNLRNAYCQELKKIVQSIEAAGSEDSPDVYKPKVQWFGIMDSFMRPHMQSAKAALLVNRRKNENKQAVKVKMENEESCHSGQDDWEVQQNESNAPETSYSYCESINCDSEEISADSQPQSKRRRRSNSSQRTEQADNCDRTTSDLLNDIRQVYPNLTGATNDVVSVVTPMPKNEDIFDHFGKYIASLLRCLPEEQALRLQPEIVNMIIQVRIKDGLKIEMLDSSSAQEAD